jgi:hypothetical protein
MLKKQNTITNMIILQQQYKYKLDYIV